MLSKQLTIINKLGLHARATTKLVTLVNQFTADVMVQYNHKTANAKSIMGLMMLAAAQGSQLRVIVTGEDENECLIAVTELINNRFAEGE